MTAAKPAFSEQQFRDWADVAHGHEIAVALRAAAAQARELAELKAKAITRLELIELLDRLIDGEWPKAGLADALINTGAVMVKK